MNGGSSDLERVLREPGERPRLAIDSRDWETLLGWARATDREVSGLGHLDVRHEVLHVTKIYLPPQLSSPIETQLSPDGLARLLLDIVSTGADPASLRLWWHSHGREKPFWSSLDERTIESFAPSPMASLVFDHAGQRLARLDAFEPRLTRWLDVDLNPRGSSITTDHNRLRDDVTEQVGDLGGPARLTYRPRH